MHYVAFSALGVVAGLIAGLLGVGGGVIIVPGLLLVFELVGIERWAMQLALGTSLASICFTSLSSVRAHHRRGAVDWRIFSQLVPGVLAGSFGGAFVAARLPTLWLKLLFGAYLVVIGLRMLRQDDAPETAGPRRSRYGVAGLGIGVLSALVGIGGGSLTIPLMLSRGESMRRAVGTSAAVGFPIALAGASGYVVNGRHVTGLPEHSVGFVHLVALLCLVVPSVLTAPLGARLAHRLRTRSLRGIFATFLLIVAGKMLFSTLTSLR